MPSQKHSAALQESNDFDKYGLDDRGEQDIFGRPLAHSAFLRYNRAHRTANCANLHDYVSYLHAIDGVAVETYDRLRAVRESHLDPQELAPLPVVSFWKILLHSLTGLAVGLFRIPMR